MSWISLKDSRQLEEIVAESKKEPVLIYKHSTRCNISRAAFDRLERKWNPAALGAVIGATTGIFGFLQTPGFPSIAGALFAALAWYIGFRVLAWRRRTAFARDELAPFIQRLGTA